MCWYYLVEWHYLNNYDLLNEFWNTDDIAKAAECADNMWFS